MIECSFKEKKGKYSGTCRLTEDPCDGDDCLIMQIAEALIQLNMKLKALTPTMSPVPPQKSAKSPETQPEKIKKRRGRPPKVKNPVQGGGARSMPADQTKYLNQKEIAELIGVTSPAVLYKRRQHSIEHDIKAPKGILLFGPGKVQHIQKLFEKPGTKKAPAKGINNDRDLLKVLVRQKVIESGTEYIHTSTIASDLGEDFGEVHDLLIELRGEGTLESYRQSMYRVKIGGGQ